MGLATFRGQHNRVKSKVLLLLCQYSGEYYTADELSRILGLNKHSLQTLVGRWYSWGRIKRKLRSGIEFEYGIAPRGRAWFERWRDDGMPVQRYVAEIRAWQEGKHDN